MSPAYPVAGHGRRCSISIPAIGGVDIQASATTLEQVKEIKRQLEPLLFQISGVNGVGISSCYVGSDALIKPGTLPASEPCISVGFVSEEALKNAKAILASPLKVKGVGIALYVLGQIHPQ